MACKKVYGNHAEKLVRCLPMDDALFITALSTKNLLPGDTKEQIKAKFTQAEKASYFLSHVIEPALDIDDTSDFNALISVMQMCGYNSVQKLAHTIKLEIDSTDEAKSRISGSSPVEFSSDEKMERAYGKLISQFVKEFSQPPPCGPSLSQVKVLCINYCEFHHHEKTDFASLLTSMDDLFSYLLANPLYCNFLNLGLLEYLAECVDNECLKVSIRNYNDTFCNVKIITELDNMAGYRVKVIRSGSWTRQYKIMFMKLIKEGITYGQIRRIKLKIAQGVIFVPQNSLIIKWYRKGCVCLGWLIPSCLVDSAYHFACASTALLTQLGIKYLIIGNYKIQPPTINELYTSETPMDIFCKQYQVLIQKLQPEKLSNNMFSNGLLNKRDYTMIKDAPCDLIKNRMIIEHVRQRSSSYLFTFLAVLQKLEDQKSLYDTLVNVLQSAGFLYLPDDYDITALDEDDVNSDSLNSDDQANHSFSHFFLDRYVNSCLKMNVSVKKQVQRSLPMQNILSADYNTKILTSTINRYLYVVDNLCKLMESCDPGVFLDKCSSLMASDVHNIPLFSSDFLKELDDYRDVSIMLRYLMCYFTWRDLSIVMELLKIRDFPGGVKLLQKFSDLVKFTEPANYHVFIPESLMVPSRSSTYTLMVNFTEIIFNAWDIEMIKLEICRICEITFIACHFLGTPYYNSKVFLYWLIPKSVALLILSKAQQNWKHLYNCRIRKLSIYGYKLSLPEVLSTQKVKKYVIPPVILTNLDLAWISEKLKEVDSLYMYLDLSIDEWLTIHADNPRNYESLKLATLLKWHEKKGFDEATLANLVTVLTSSENEDAELIQEIIDHFKCRIGSYSQVSDDKEQPVAITTGRAEILKGTHRISVDKEQPVAIKTGRAEILKGTHRVSVDKELSVAIKTGRNEILKLTERVSDDKELPVAIKTRSAEILKLTQRVSDDMYIEQPVAIKTGSAKTLELTHKASDDKEQPVAIKRTHTPSSMDIIYQLYPQMVKYIDLDSLVPHFYKNGVLTSRERYYFNNFFKSPTEKIHYLLQYIDGKGEDTVQKFLQALKEEKKHPRHIELCRLLKQNGVNM